MATTKTYTVCRRFSVEASRQISAESFAEAETKAKALRADRFFRAAPGADLCDWDDLDGMSIHEERE